MTYAGLTTADKPALLDAKARGAEWVARDKDDELAAFRLKPQKYVDMELNSDHWERTQAGNYFIVMPSDELLKFIQWSDAEPVNIDLALAQIAEMESKPEPEMTVHGYSIKNLELIAILMRDNGVTPEDVKEAARNYSSGAMFAFNAATEQINKGFSEAVERMHSPYAKGETKNG